MFVAIIDNRILPHTSPTGLQCSFQLLEEKVNSIGTTISKKFLLEEGSDWYSVLIQTWHVSCLKNQSIITWAAYDYNVYNSAVAYR